MFYTCTNISRTKKNVIKQKFKHEVIFSLDEFAFVHFALMNLLMILIDSFLPINESGW